MKDSDTHPKPVLAVHKYVKPPAPRHEPETQEAMDAYDKAHAISREALMLELRLASGKIVSFPYMSLREAMYSPEGIIEMKFDAKRVTAEGRNLHRLHESIIQHRQRFIQEGTDIERGLKDADAVHVERIVITDANEE